MKKIVSVLALSALVAGSVFAEVSITGNQRLGTNLFSVKKPGAVYTDSEKKTETEESKKAKTTYGFNDMTKADWTDDLLFKFNGEKAGVTMKMAVSQASIKMSDASLWLKFGDAFKLSAGKYDTRGYMNRCYNGFDGNWFNNYGEPYKPGTYQKVTFGVDSGNVSAVKGSKTVNFMGEYAITDGMNARLALFQGGNGETPFVGFNGAAQFDMKQDKFILTFTAKVKGGTTGNGKDNSTSFGLFVNPIVVKGLDLLVGYTFADEKSFDDVAKNSAHAIDVRAAYTTGAIRLATLNNITINDSNLYTWHSLCFAYQVSDLLSAVGVQAKLESGSKAWGSEDKTTKKADNDTASLNVRPYIDLTVQTNAVLSIGVDVGVSNLLGNSKKDATITVDIPVVARVKL